MDVYVGIDGGGTRAAAVVIDRAGKELARVRGGPALVTPTTADLVAQGLVELASSALAAAGASTATAVCCALAGAGRETVSTAVREAVAAAGLSARTLVVTDAAAALQDATSGGPGLLLVAGTGSIAWGRAEDGRTGRVGGWGPVLGDEGSGYDLGAAALRAAARAADGRGPDTTLLQAVLASCGLDEPDALIGWVAAADKRAVAGLAPLVFAAADAGDAVASGIADAAAAALAEQVLVLHGRLGPWTGPALLALAGGLIRPAGPLRRRVVEALAAEQDGPRVPVRILERDVDAASGACALARVAEAGEH